MRQPQARPHRGTPLLEPLEPRLLLSADVIINEFLANNDDGLTDENGDHSDWIELYNRGTSAANLEGWHLKDTDHEWHLPAVTLDANQYLVIFASGKDRNTVGSPLHTNFKLDNNSEYLALTRPDGAVVTEFSPEYADQQEDVSYGRYEQTSTTPLVIAGASDRVLAPTSNGLGLTWTGTTFDDSAWTGGMTGAGFEKVAPVFGAGKFYYAPFGPNGTWNLYEVVSGNQTWINAYNQAKLRTQGGKTGHLVTITSAAENAFVRSIVTTTSWIGLTDSDTFAALGAYEGYNTSGDPLPPAGTPPGATNRGRGFVWVTGEAFTYQNWKSANPDNATPGEDGVEIETGGGWNDSRNGETGQTGLNRGAYVVEYETGLTSLGPSFTVTEARTTSSLTTVTQALTALSSLSSTYTYYTVPFINHADPQNTIGNGRFPGNLPFGSDTTADDNNFAIRFTATIKIATAGEYTFGLKADDGVRLKIGGATFTSCTLLAGTAGTLTVSGETMDHSANGSWEGLGVATLSAGEHTVEIIYFEGAGGSGIEFHAAAGAKTAFDTTFRLVGDTQNGGLAVKGLGDLVSTNVQTPMLGINASAYVRVAFEQTETGLFDRLVLRMKYDDGFVAYLNGMEVARANAPASPTWNSTATADHPYDQATAYATFDISQYRDLLVVGTNVLAIHGLNVSADSTDFLVLPELDGLRTLSVDQRYFLTPSPRASNSTGTVAFVAETKFSRDRGFYEEAFDVEITCATPGAEIRYTTDGSAPTATHGTVYTAPIPIAGTTILRAGAYKTDWQPVDTKTHTYLFISQVLQQTGAGFPANWSTATADYAVDPNVINDPRYAAVIAEDLQAIPTMSLVMDVNDLFGPTGLYSNPTSEGVAWERAGSLEYFDPDGGSEFQINAGVRIYGGVSRSLSYSKHSFRIAFKDDYGPTKLDFPLFGDGAADSFDNLILRGNFNNSWPFWVVSEQQRAQYVRDLWMHDTQRAMGWPSSNGTYVHLYINGLYWGLYNPDERQDASFSAEYLGGDKTQYDVLNSGNPIDGDKNAWTEMRNLANTGQTATGGTYNATVLADPALYAAIQQYLNVTNLADYMLMNFYGGNLDWDNHNWYAARQREVGAGYVFYAWDSERILEDANADKTGVNEDDKPSRLYYQLRANAEWKLLFADRVYESLFNDGALTPQVAADRFMDRAQEIDRAIAGESLRWGDFTKEPPYTRDNEWITEQTRLLTQYFPVRTTNLLNRLRQIGLYPTLDAPMLGQHGGKVAAGAQATLSAPAGAIYYTLDGTDPRLTGGGIAPGALSFTGSGTLTFNASTRVKARAFDGTNWSALDDATFRVDIPVRITEILYHAAPPPVGSTFSEDAFKFIEIQNIGASTLNLSGLRLTGGVAFTFPNLDLPAGQYAVVVADQAAFESRYGTGVRIAGTFTGTLSKGGEKIRLEGPIGDRVLNFDFEDGWYGRTDGDGFSLVVVNPLADTDLWDSKDGWRSSANPGGSPGAADIGYAPNSVIINEVLAHQDTEPPGDWIELKNTTAAEINIGGWYLSDDAANLLKYRIADGTRIGAGQCYAFTESAHFGAFFSLSELGESVYLTSSPAAGVAGGYRESESFGANDRDATLGRYVKSTGGADFVSLASQTMNGDNAGPAVGPVVINEILYNPAIGGDEFIELYSITGANVLLYDPAYPENTWRFTNGINFAFPTGSVLRAHAYALVVGTDPATFRSKYGIPLSVDIYGPYTGVLNDSGETLELSRPGTPETVPVPLVPCYRVDQVTYGIDGHWPTRADGRGSSLVRLNPAAYGNEATNWAASTTGGSPGAANVLPDTTAPTVPGGMTAATIPGTTQVSLSWTPASDAESGVTYYRIYRSGAQIAATTSTTFTDTTPASGTTYSYDVSAVNRDDIESAKTGSPAAIRVVVLNTASAIDGTTVKAVFGENMLRDSAQEAANYTLTCGGVPITVTGAALLSDSRSVLLTLASPVTAGVSCTVTVNNVMAQSLYPVVPNFQKTFTWAGPGSLLRQYWTGITGGTAITLLTGNANYPNSPNGMDELTLFEAPSNWADNYGTRVRGYVTAPQTGNYIFWIAADDTSELWLSTSEDPALATKIAYGAASTNAREWKTGTTQSVAITLVEGQRYYIEALQKENTGSDHLSVGWQLPDGTYERPIPNARLSPFSVADMTLSLTATDPNAAEAGQDKGTFTLTRAGNTAKAITVYYTVGGSARTADMQSYLSGSVTMNANVSSVTISVTPVNDTVNEADETVTLTLVRDLRYTINPAAASATVTIVDNELPTVTGVAVNGMAGRSTSAIDPGAMGLRTIDVDFSETVTFGDTDVVLQTVAFPGGVETVTGVITPSGVAGSNTSHMTITLPAAVDTWVKVTLRGSGTLRDLTNRNLDGEARAGGTGLGYVYSASLDLPTGNGTPGGDAVFYVGNLRGDFAGTAGPDADGVLTYEDVQSFLAAHAARSLDADFRGAGFGVRPPDGRITVADIDGFTAVYQAGVDAGRHLDPLPGSGTLGGASLDPVTAPMTAVAAPAATAPYAGVSTTALAGVIPDDEASALDAAPAVFAATVADAAIPPAGVAPDAPVPAPLHATVITDADAWWLDALPAGAAGRLRTSAVTATLGVPPRADTTPALDAAGGIDTLLALPALDLAPLA